MENNPVKTFTDKESFEKIFNNIFSKYQAFLKTKHTAIRVKFISYTDGCVSFELNDCKLIEDTCVIACRDKSDNTIFAYLKLIEGKEKHTCIFSPEKIEVAFAPRKEEREILDPDNNANHRLFIINMISEFIIKNNLDLYKKKLLQIEDTIKIKLEKTFENIHIYFIHHGHDERMNYFKKHIRPIFIANMNEEPPEKDKEMYKFYIENIYSEDNSLKNRKELISEISVPVLFNMKIPYGYVQVNNTSSFTESYMQIVKKMSTIVNELLTKHGLFPKTEEKITVYNVSKNGIGVIFKNKQFIKYFNKDQLVYFDLLLTDNKKVNILAIVKNISIEGSTYIVGSQITEIDALSEVYYDEYLESIGLKIQNK